MSSRVIQRGWVSPLPQKPGVKRAAWYQCGCSVCVKPSTVRTSGARNRAATSGRFATKAASWWWVQMNSRSQARASRASSSTGSCMWYSTPEATPTSKRASGDSRRKATKSPSRKRARVVPTTSFMTRHFR